MNIVEASIRVLRQDKADVLERARTLVAASGCPTERSRTRLTCPVPSSSVWRLHGRWRYSPQLMLFDGPTSALDPELCGEVLDVMKQLVDHGVTMIVVTHEIGFTMDAADEVVFMDGGAIVEQGASRDVLRRPAEQRAKKFLGSVLDRAAP